MVSLKVYIFSGLVVRLGSCGAASTYVEKMWTCAVAKMVKGHMAEKAFPVDDFKSHMGQ